MQRLSPLDASVIARPQTRCEGIQATAGEPSLKGVASWEKGAITAFVGFPCRAPSVLTGVGWEREVRRIESSHRWRSLSLDMNAERRQRIPVVVDTGCNRPPELRRSVDMTITGHSESQKATESSPGRNGSISTSLPFLVEVQRWNIAGNPATVPLVASNGGAWQ